MRMCSSRSASTFSGSGDADLYLLTLPLANDLPVLTLSAAQSLGIAVTGLEDL